MATMIYNVTAVLMDGGHTVLPGAYVVVDGHRITDFGAQRPQGFTGKCIDGKGGILMRWRPSGTTVPSGPAPPWALRR